MRRTAKPSKAAKSASESSLRSNAVSAFPTRSVFPTLSRKRTVSMSQLVKGKKVQQQKGPKKVKSTQVKKSEDKNIIDAEVVSVTPASARQFTEKTSTKAAAPSGPKAIGAPKKAPAKSKASKKTKKETTPGMQRVYKATPAVNLNEGPDFGKPTSIIEPTFQPKTPKAPKKTKNA